MAATYPIIERPQWVDSGTSAIGLQLAKADFADEFKILSLRSALPGSLAMFLTTRPQVEIALTH